MAEYTQITLNEWMQWKEDIRRKLAETAGNFVYIGYRLKQIRDSGMLDGCADIFEFAHKEYGLGKSTVSRFIAINEKFSKNGNSLELKEEFEGISSSKLAEMLTLTDAECQLITAQTTVKEIRDLKEFNRQQTLDSEVVETEEKSYTPLQKCIIDFFKDRKELLNKTMEMLGQITSEQDTKEIAELINPGGYTTHKKGIIFLFMYDYQTGIKYKLLTEPAPVCMSWTEIFAEIIDIYQMHAYEPQGVWNSFYNVVEKPEEIAVEKCEETQENTGFEVSVATSQQEVENAQKEEEKETGNEPPKTKEESENALTTIAREEISSPTEETDSMHNDIESDTVEPDRKNEHIEDKISKIYDDAYDLASALEEYFIDEKKRMTQKDLEEMKSKSEQLTKVIEQLILLVKEQL